MRLQLTAISLLFGLSVLSCGTKPKNTERTESVASGMTYDFWLTDPAVAPPVYFNPFGSASWGSDVSTAISWPFTAEQCPACRMTSIVDTSGAPAYPNVNSLTDYANHLWTVTGSAALANAKNSLESQRDQIFAASYASNLSSTMTQFQQFFQQWPGVNPSSVVVNHNVEQPWVRAYKPVQTRQLGQLGTTVFHPQPYVLEEARYRGARSYCAMREAARQQDLTGAYSMGSSSTAQFAFWELGASEATVAIGAPYKDTTSKVANWFVIPIAIGSNLAPISGLGIPTVGQVVHPVAWIAGDAVVLSHEGGNQIWINSQHADAFTGQRSTASLSAPQLPLATWGFLSLSGGFSYTAEYGTLLAESGVTGSFSTPLSYGTGWRTNMTTIVARSNNFDELVLGSYQPSTVATDAAMYKDGILYPYSTFGVYSTVNGSTAGLQRWNMADDRSLSVGDAATETLALTVSGGLDLPLDPLHVTLTVSGSSNVSLTTQRITTIREHISGVAMNSLSPAVSVPPANPTGPGIQPWAPQANVLITPETKTVSNVVPLTIGLDVRLQADFGIFSIDKQFHHTLYQSPAFTLFSGQEIGRENTRLRVGTFTDFGFEYATPQYNYRSTYSHLPDPTEPVIGNVASFASFPDNGLDSVGACLADTGTVPGTPPPPQLGNPPATTDSELCVYGPACRTWTDPQCAPFNLPANICTPGVINSWVTANFPGAGYSDCLREALNFLCSSNPNVQNWGSLGKVVARTIQTAEVNDIAQIQSACLDVLAPTNQTEGDLAAAMVDSLFRYGLCDGNGALLGDPVAD